MVRLVNLNSLFHKSLTNSPFTQSLNTVVKQLNKNSKNLTADRLCIDFFLCGWIISKNVSLVILTHSINLCHILVSYHLQLYIQTLRRFRFKVKGTWTINILYLKEIVHWEYHDFCSLSAGLSNISDTPFYKQQQSLSPQVLAILKEKAEESNIELKKWETCECGLTKEYRERTSRNYIWETKIRLESGLY